MRVAAIFHNRLLRYDGYDNFDWAKCDPAGEEPEVEAVDVPDLSEETNDGEVNEEEQPPVESLTQVAEVGSQVNPIPFRLCVIKSNR